MRALTNLRWPAKMRGEEQEPYLNLRQAGAADRRPLTDTVIERRKLSAQLLTTVDFDKMARQPASGHR